MFLVASQRAFAQLTNKGKSRMRVSNALEKPNLYAGEGIHSMQKSEQKKEHNSVIHKNNRNKTKKDEMKLSIKE